MNIHDFPSTEFAARAGWTLLHSLWQGVVLAALVAAAMVILRRRSPQARYIVSSGALALMLLCVGVTFWRVAPTAGVSRSASPPHEAPAGSVHFSPARQVTTVSDADAAKMPSPSAMGQQSNVVTPDRLESLVPWLSGLWLFGVLALSIWRLGGWVAAQRLRVLGVRPVGADVAGLVARLARRLKLSRPPAVFQSLVAMTPMVIGWARPVVLLPVAVLSGLTRQQLEAVLAHELAHVRRHDYLVNLFQVAAETLLFYHPAVWLISRRIRLEREQCCDDAAVSVCGDRCAYAESLAALEEVRFGGPIALAARGSGGAQLLSRVRRLLGEDDAGPRRSAGAAAVALGTLALAVMILTGVGTRPGAAIAADAIEVKSPATAPASRPAAETRPADAQRQVLEAQLQQARAAAARRAQTFKAGVTSLSDLQDAQDRVAILEAELTGDAMRVAAVRFESARRRLAIAQALRKNGVISAEEFEKAEADAAVAEALLRAAEERDKAEPDQPVRITGVVRDPDGKPVAGATVAPADGTGNSLTGDTAYSVPTAADGSFVMLLPATGKAKYNLVAHDGAHAQWRTWGNGVLPPIQTKPGEELKDVVITLTRPATVRGHLVDEAGKPLAGRQVRASAADRLENRYYDPTTTTDKDGNFELRFIRPGEQFIEAAPFWLREDDPPAGHSAKVTLRAGETKEKVDLTARTSMKFFTNDEQLHLAIERAERAKRRDATPP